MPSLFLFPLLAFLFCSLLHLLALKVFPQIPLLDFPERYGLRRPRLPYPTGIIAIMIFLIFFVIVIPLTNDQFPMTNFQNNGIVLGIIVLGLTSFIDDRTPLPSPVRLTVQILIAFCIFATGSRIYTITNPLEGWSGIPFLKLDTIDIPAQLSIIHYSLSIFPTPLPLWSGIFTIFWLLLTINALNWFDGIPGQVSTLSGVSFLVLGFLSLSDRVNQPDVALLAFILAGISFACFLFDFPPPRVLMGDTGAMFFGLMLGVLTIYAGGKVATAFLVLGVPLIDSLLVVIQRLFQAKNPLKGSLRREHLHHRLLERGWNPWQIILLTTLLGSCFGLTALFLSTFEKFFAALLLLGIMGGLFLYTGIEPKRMQKK